MKKSDKITPAIEIKNIHKEFILPQNKNTSMKQAAVNIVKRNNKVTQKVLDGVSFTINKGDFFGIVGRNGSGKSTLLKLIAGVYYPTKGNITLHGGLTPFIELGVGFNPELSGRDNVYLNGALLGFSRAQMDAMYDEIVEFAELEPFMGQKLKNYSSGMQVRLAFSIAIKARNDILIFDEVLAVGDEAFQRKCLDVFESYKASGQTVVLVTHDMKTVEQFCNRAALIGDGKLIEVGSARKVAQLYSELNQAQIDKETQQQNEKQGKSETEDIFTITITDTEGKKRAFKYGETLRAEITWKQLDKLESIGVNIFKRSGEHITGQNTRFIPDFDIAKQNSITIEFTLNMTPGKYFIYAEAFHEPGKAYPVEFDGPSFIITPEAEGIDWSGLQKLPHTWRQ
ncbi:MAG: ABC transporter ATP-binding protein [Candidatus Saccharibacteria bacterium]|nr:ABC transporter ATP-binding protein [Candidatus Saccharibacteria bacterium]